MAASSIGGGGPQTFVFGPRIDPNRRDRATTRNRRPKLMTETRSTETVEETVFGRFDSITLNAERRTRRR